jgi:hypothetical protein
MSKRNGSNTLVVMFVATLAALAARSPAFAQNADELPEVLKGDGVTLYKTYQPPDKSFQILYDSTWKVIPGQGVGVAVRFVNEKDAKPGRATELVQLGIVPAKGRTLAQIAAGMKAALVAKPGHKIVEDDALTIKGDNVPERNVHRFVYDSKNRDGTPVRGIEFVIVQDDFGYVITYLMPPEKYKETSDAAIQWVAMFKVTGKPQAAAANADAKPADAPAPAVPAKEPAAAITAAPDGWIKWESPDKAISLAYPKGWETKDPGVPEAVAAFVDTDGSAPGILAGSLTVLKVPTGGNVNFTAGSADFNAWIKAMRGGLSGTVPEFKPLDEKIGTVAGIPAVCFTYETREPDSPKVRCIQWIVAKGNVAYVLMYHVDPSRFDKFLPTERAITESFTLAGQAKPAAAVARPPPPKVALRPTLFESKEHAFKFTYPAGWGEVPLKAEGVVLALGKQASAGKQAQMLMALSDKIEPTEKLTLKEMEAKLLELARGGIKDVKVVEATDLKFGGEPARRLLISGVRVLDDHEIRCLLVFAIHGRETVGFLGSAPIEDAESFKADFDKTIESFAFTAAAPAAPQTTAAKPGADAKPAATPVAFASAEHGLRLAQPAGWTARKTPDPATLLLLFPDTMKGSPRSIQLTADPFEAGQPKPTLKDQADGALAGLKALAMPDAKILESADLKVGIEKARRIVIGGHNPKDKGEMRAVCVLFQHAGESVTLSGRSSLADFDALKEAVDAITASLELTNATKKLK